MLVADEPEPNEPASGLPQMCSNSQQPRRIRNGKTHCAYTGSYNSLQDV